MILEPVPRQMESRKILVFRMENQAEAFEYVVSEDDWKRVSSCFEQYSEALGRDLIEFLDVQHNRVIFVNPDYVLIHQALFEAGMYPVNPDPDVDADLDRVSFYLYGRAEPLHSDHMDDDVIGDINFRLRHLVPEEYPFFSFIDCDGELVSLRAERIMLVESPDYDVVLEGDDEKDFPKRRANREPDRE